MRRAAAARRAVAAACAATVAVPAAGSAATPAPGPDSALLAHLPRSTRTALVANVTRARAVLGLPAGTPFYYRHEASRPRVILFSAVSVAFFDAESPAPAPIFRTLDQHDVTAVATGQGTGSTVAVALTSESSPRLAAGLRRAGFRQGAEGAWTARWGLRASPEYQAVALFPGGFTETDAVRRTVAAAEVARAAAGRTPPTRRAALAAELGAAGSTPVAGASLLSRGCVAAVSITDEIAPDTGTERILARRPSAVRLSDGRSAGIRVGAATRVGATFIAALSEPPTALLPTPFPALLPIGGRPPSLWSCHR